MVKAARSHSQPPRAVLAEKKNVISKRVDELEQRLALSDEEEFELKRLKKEKLATKDMLESGK